MWDIFVYIIAFSSLCTNAMVTGVLLFNPGGINGSSIELLIAETILILAIALLILVKLLDKVVRRRENKYYEGDKSDSRTKKSKRVEK